MYINKKIFGNNELKMKDRDTKWQYDGLRQQ